MAVYYKPQSPIQSGEDFIYPITTADQVKVDKDTRLNAVGVYLKNIDNSTDTTVYGNNATTLGGVAAEDYALKTDTAPDSSKLGGVAASDYALKTDTAPDSSKLGGKAPEYYIQPRNLLDNSDFRNPVNQRGATSYEATNGYYNIDRWVGWRETPDITPHVIVQDGYITVETGTKLQQKIASYKQNTIYTAAAKRTDGTVLIISSMFTTDEIGKDIYIRLSSDGRATIGVRSGDYLWVALYEGTYTAETLPPYVPKGYAAELAECQRYFERIGQSGNGGAPASMLLAVGTAGEMRVLQGYRVPKRIISPTIMVNGKAVGETVSVRNTMTNVSCTGVLSVWNNTCADRLNTLTVAGTSVVGAVYEGYLDIIADL